MDLITSQTGIKSVKNDETYANNDLFRGIIKLDNNNISQFDPMVGGYGFFVWCKGPRFMTINNSANIMWERFKNLTEKGFTSFEGIGDMTVNFEDITGGANGTTFRVANSVKDDFDTFTMRVYELQGSAVREPLQFWVEGIRDKHGYCNYKGMMDAPYSLEYAAKNHTGELLYVMSDPTGRKVEYACYICNIMPTKVPKGHVNITGPGDHPIVQFDLEFSGYKYESAYINNVAAKICKKFLENGTLGINKVSSHLGLTRYNDNNPFTVATYGEDASLREIAL